MKSIYLAIAAMSAAVLLTGAAPASASTCASDCNANYTTCNNADGINGQSICTPKWMQCKRACSAPVAAKTVAKTTPVKLVATTKVTKIATAPVKH